MALPHHLLVTNDFPPKTGGIQSYLWELWRRLPPSSFTVLTTPHPDAAAFDGQQAFRVVRAREAVLLPTPWLVRRIDALAADVGASLVVLDPALPVGLLGPHLALPYALVVHGAEVTVYGRLPVGRQAMRRVVRGAVHVVAAGGYPAAEAARAAGRGQAPPTTVVPPGVDTDRFAPLDADGRVAARRRLGLPVEATIVLGQSRLVPRKGFDVLIEAAGRLAADHPDLVVVIGGRGRDRARLERLAARSGAVVRFVGWVRDEDLADLYGCADLFAMCCRGNRWGGLEQEGFGIVFVEAAACGVAQVAGASGGSAEAVEDGVTGAVVTNPGDPAAVAAALRPLLGDPDLRARMGAAARRRAVEQFEYDRLAADLTAALAQAADAASARTAG